MLSRIALAGWLLIFVAECAPAQTSRPTTPVEVMPRRFSINGAVRLATNEAPVAMVRVDLRRFSGEVVATAFTRSNGEFEFHVPGGSYVLEVSHDGYQPIREDVELTNSPRLGVFLYLRPIENYFVPQPGHAVSARELALPRRARDALNSARKWLYEKNNAGRSVIDLQKVLVEAPEFYEAYYHLGMAYTALQKDSDAESALRRSIEMSLGEYAEPYFALGALLLARHDLTGAEAALRRGLELDESAWQGHFEMIRLMLALNRPADAERHSQQAHLLNRSYAPLHLAAANIFIRTKNYNALLAELDEYLELEPKGQMSEQVRKTRVEVLKILVQNSVPPADLGARPKP